MSSSGNQKNIYDFCSSLYQNEQFLEKHSKDENYQGFLIEKNIIDKFKTEIQYEQIKLEIKKDIETGNNLNKEPINAKKVKLPQLIPKKFNNSNDLKKELKNKKSSYYIMKNKYMVQIITESNKLNGKETKFSFEKDHIVIQFNEDDKLYFCINKDWAIEETYLYGKSSKDQTNNHTENSFVKSDSPRNSIINEFKSDIEILVRLFYFDKYLKKNEIDSNKKLSEEIHEIVYLINNSWIEEYKFFFEYSSLEHYLNSKKEYFDEMTKDNYLSDENLKKILEYLNENEYIKKLKEKKNGFIPSKNFNFDTKKSKGNKSYIDNIQIIDSKIYQLLLLKKREYKLNDIASKKVQLYFIGKKKIFLFFPNKIEKDKEID